MPPSLLPGVTELSVGRERDVQTIHLTPKQARRLAVLLLHTADITEENNENESS